MPMNTKTTILLATLLGACHTYTGETGDTASCNDADEDGVCGEDDVCPGADDGQDADGDSVPDACEIDLLGSMDTSQNFLETSSTRLGVQLAYDTHLATSQWLIFEPPLEVGHDAPEATAWTRDLGGWDAVQARLTDGVDEDFCTYVTGLEDDFHQAMTLREDYYDLSGLEGAIINQVQLEVRDWQHEEETQTAIFSWSFYGYVP
jgi:hypothetical protein